MLFLEKYISFTYLFFWLVRFQSLALSFPTVSCYHFSSRIPYAKQTITSKMALSHPEKVILCTGANRSLGFAILQATALRLPSATYLLGSRSTQAGEEAVEELKQLGIKAPIEVLQLDVSKDSSIFVAAETVKAKYGKLDGKSCHAFPSASTHPIT